jgi:hypothetical protein
MSTQPASCVDLHIVIAGEFGYAGTGEFGRTTAKLVALKINLKFLLIVSLCFGERLLLSL